VSKLNTERLPDVAGTGGGQLEPVHLQPAVGAQSQQFVFCEDLPAGSSARLGPVRSAVETTSKLRVAAKIIIIFFTFLNFHGLCEVVNVDDVPPLVVEVQRSSGENDFLISSAELFILDTEEPGGDIDVGALIVEDLLEKLPSHSWIFSQEMSGQVQGVVGGVRLLTVILTGARAAQAPRRLPPILALPCLSPPVSSLVVSPGARL